MNAYLHYFGLETFRLSVWLVLLAVVFVPLERLLALHPAPIWRRQVGVDLAWYFLNSLFPAFVIGVPIAVLVRALQGANPFGIYAWEATWPLWVKLPLMFFVNDFGSYWAHRATHKLPFLWRFHAVHHSAEHMDWLVNTRAHPVDIVFTRLVGMGLIYVTGLAQATGHRLDNSVAWVTIAGTMWAFFIHANVRLRLGVLEWLVATPAFHHWHHTRREHQDRNFAAIFPIFDFVFGTAWLPREWPVEYGTDTKVPATLVGQLVDPVLGGEPPPAPPS